MLKNLLVAAITYLCSPAVKVLYHLALELYLYFPLYMFVCCASVFVFFLSYTLELYNYNFFIYKMGRNRVS
jgi:hypothetical protein